LAVRSLNLPPLPIENVRDLLGIVRALYLAWGKDGPEVAARRRELVAIGLDLRKAIELAEKGGPGSLGNSAAWDRAERATKALGLIVDSFVTMRPSLDAVAGELGRKRRGRVVR
jgi:hypothetical protein